MRVEPRADGLWRIEHVPQDLRSEQMEAVRRLGKAETSYRKITFQKSDLERDQHADAVLFRIVPDAASCGPKKGRWAGLPGRHVRRLVTVARPERNLDPSAQSYAVTRDSGLRR